METFEYMNRQPISVRVPPELRGVRGQIRWMEGKKIFTYKVIRRTACMILVEPVSIYYVFLRWRGNKRDHRVFDPREIIGVVEQDTTRWATRRMKPWNINKMENLIDEVNGYKIVHKIKRWEDIEYNPETEKLDIECGRGLFMVPT